jgi:hypothetical protein
MGFWSSLFGYDGPSDSGERVRESVKEHGDHVRGDKFTFTGGGEHVHESYDLDRSSGEYKEYGGGEKSGDRSYNK